MTRGSAPRRRPPALVALLALAAPTFGCTPSPEDASEPSSEPAASPAPDVAHYISAAIGAGTWQPGRKLRLLPAYPALTFEQPVRMVPGPSGDGGWYVLERAGRVKRFDAEPNVASARAVLDLTDRVNSDPGEAGLLGIAFHPRYPEDPRVFLSFTTGKGRKPVSTVAALPAPPGAAWDPSALQVLWTLDQPYGNHNGGHIAFGPDGLLYAGYGDGGSAADPHDHGQNPRTWLGSLLRVDVNARSGKKAYAIPADNPFAKGGRGAPEVYAWGLRNPWTFSFDRVTGRLWLADVGQYEWEEVDVIEKGRNYGWRIREGRHCFRPKKDCPRAGLVDPVAEYDHSQGDKSITGGFVYRGERIEGLAGTYVYGDFASGRIWGIPADPPGAVEKGRLLVESGKSIPAFGEGKDGELYVLDFYDGKVFTLAAGEE